MKRRLKKKLTAFLCLTLIFTINCPPFATIAYTIATSGIVDDIGNLSKHLYDYATSGSGVFARADSEGDYGTVAISEELGDDINGADDGHVCPIVVDCSGCMSAISAVEASVSALKAQHKSDVYIINQQLRLLESTLNNMETYLLNIQTNTGSIDENLKGFITAWNEFTNEFKAQFYGSAKEDGTHAYPTQKWTFKIDGVNYTYDIQGTGLIPTVNMMSQNIARTIQSIETFRDQTKDQFYVIRGILGYEYEALDKDMLRPILDEDGDVLWYTYDNVAVTDDKNTILYHQNSTIASSLDDIEKALLGTSHRYRVAHLYSLNNAFSNCLYKPYTDELPYVEDYAYVTGKFASVYDGYWNTSVSTVNNPGNYDTRRALEVLGYDAIVRREGVYVTGTLSNSGRSIERTTGITGLSGLSKNYSLNVPYKLDEDGNKLPGNIIDDAKASSYAPVGSLLSYVQELIPEDAVSYLDAVTLLYKALGQEQYTYDSYATYNPDITAENSPTAQNLSNISELEGYDFYTFVTRNNIWYTNDSGTNNYNNIYWTKAINGGFIPSNINPTDVIHAADFYILATQMMQAYGEPEMSASEIQSLLQVYGTHFPIQLGVAVADSWAYLKARGVLEVDLSAIDTITRDELLDICMRIKDKDSRTDFKNIQITLDLADVMQDTGYYPVKDLKYSNGNFAVSTTYDYSQAMSYDYLFYLPEDYKTKNANGVLVASSNPEGTELIAGAKVSINNTYTIQESEYLHLSLPIDGYTGNVYIVCVKTDSEGKFIKVEDSITLVLGSDMLVGGIFIGASGEGNDYMYLLEDESGSKCRYSFEYISADPVVLAMVDVERKGIEPHEPSTIPVNTTSLNKLKYAYNIVTSPIETYALPDKYVIDRALAWDGGGGSFSAGKTNTGSAGSAKTTYNFNLTSVDKNEDLVVINSKYRTGLDTSVKTIIADDYSAWVKEASAIHPAIQPFIKIYWLSKANMTDDIANNTTKYSGINSYSSMIAAINEHRSSNGYGPQGWDNWKVIQKLNSKIGLTEDPEDKNKEKVLMFENISGLTFDNSGRESTITFQYPPKALTYLYYNNIYPQSITTKFFMSNMDKSQFAVKYSERSSVLLYEYISYLQGDGKHIKGPTAYGLDQGTETDKAAISLIKDFKITNVTFTSPKDLYFAYAGSEENMSARIGSLNVSVVSEGAEVVDANTLSGSLASNVASTVIMNRDEQILLSWTDICNSGLGWSTSDIDSKMLMPQEDGSFYFYTPNGLVKVNNLLHTIQIGNTIYDLASQTGESPTLVYIDNSLDTPEYYLDYRCVMGIVQNSIVRDEATTTKLHHSIGLESGVVYNLNSNASNGVFETKSIEIEHCPNNYVSTSKSFSTFITKTSYDGISLSTDLTSNGENEVIEGALVDKVYQVPYVRMTLSNNIPTSNWVTVIDDNGTEITASLYVYYPKSLFQKYFDCYEQDGVQHLGEAYQIQYDKDGKVIPPPEGSIDDRQLPIKLQELIATEYSPTEVAVKVSAQSVKTEEGRTLAQELEQVYGYSIEDIKSNVDIPWYILMTYSAVADLYSKTSKFYLSEEYVIRRFELTNNSLVQCFDYYGDQVSVNDAGSIYWLDYVGFVYNIPNSFSYLDYVLGEIPLPIVNNLKGGLKIANYNVNDYGTVKFQEVNGAISEEELEYGQVLTKDGVYDINTGKTDSTLKYLPTDSDEAWLYNKGNINQVDYFKAAPVGIHYFFGGFPTEWMYLRDATKYLSQTSKIYYGSERLIVEGVSPTGDVKCTYINSDLPPLLLSTNTKIVRVYRGLQYDVFIVQDDNISMGSSTGIKEVQVSDIPANPMSDWLDNLGANKLLEAIDEGTSFIIVVIFEVVPYIGCILMMVLIGLGFMGDNKSYERLVSKTVDPVKLLTFGFRDVTNWKLKNSLLPCMIMFIVFGFLLNGNIIRITQAVIELYGIVMKWVKQF